jgi:hypothetical protein
VQHVGKAIIGVARLENPTEGSDRKVILILNQRPISHTPTPGVDATLTVFSQ